MQNRVNKILTKVIKKLNKNEEYGYTRDDLLSYMEDIQYDLCTEYLALQISGYLHLVANQSEYSLGNIYGTSQYGSTIYSATDSYVYKFREFAKPSTWKFPLTIIHDSEQWRDIATQDFAEKTQPLYGFIWNGVLRLVPTPVVTEDVFYWAYGLPTLPLSYIPPQDITNPTVTTDPLTPPEWDYCYENELLFRITEDEKYHLLYLERARKLSLQNFKQSVAGVIRVQHSSDVLGF